MKSVVLVLSSKASVISILFGLSRGSCLARLCSALYQPVIMNVLHHVGIRVLWGSVWLSGVNQRENKRVASWW